MRILLIVHHHARGEVRALLTEDVLVFKFHNMSMRLVDRDCELWNEMNDFFFSERRNRLFPGEEIMDSRFRLLSMMEDIEFDRLIFCEV